MRNVLVGFRYIASEIEKDESGFLFGFEESGGYLAHSHARDKDGLEAACLMLKAAAHYRNEGRNLVQVLHEIYDTFGYVIDVTFSLNLSLQHCADVMSYMRQQGLNTICGEHVTSFTDLLKEKKHKKSEYHRDQDIELSCDPATFGNRTENESLYFRPRRWCGVGKTKSRKCV